jgi:DNA-directed RNA polymerase subunit RPC12/RpoP
MMAKVGTFRAAAVLAFSLISIHFHAVRSFTLPKHYLRQKHHGSVFWVEKTGQKFMQSSDEDISEPIIVEIMTKKVYAKTEQQRQMTPRKRMNKDEKSAVDIVGSYSSSLYDDVDEGKKTVFSREKVLDSQLRVILNLATSPLSIIFFMYIFIYAKTNVGDVLNILLVKVGWRKAADVKGNQRDRNLNDDELKVLPFEVYECEKCQMQMRPAKGRAEKIFGRERFRCSRCGSKASTYFNIDDLDDPRATDRLDRLEKEANNEEAYYEEDDDDMDDEEDEE